MADLFLSYTEAFKKMIYVSQIYLIEKDFRENDLLSCFLHPVSVRFSLKTHARLNASFIMTLALTLSVSLSRSFFFFQIHH